MPGTIMTCTQERYLLFLSDNVTKDAKRYLIECIERQGLHVEEENCPEQEVIAVRAPFGLLAEEVGVYLSKNTVSVQFYRNLLVLDLYRFLLFSCKSRRGMRVPVIYIDDSYGY